MNCELQQLLQSEDTLRITESGHGSCTYNLLQQTYLSGDEDLLQQPVVILLKGIQLSLPLGLGAQLSVFDHFRIEVTIWVEIMRAGITKCLKYSLSMT